MNNWKNVEGMKKYFQDLIDRVFLRMQKKMKGALSEPNMKLLKKIEKKGEKNHHVVVSLCQNLAFMIWTFCECLIFSHKDTSLGGLTIFSFDYYYMTIIY